MKLQFDPNQDYQRQAVAAVVDIFSGQQRGAAALSSVPVPGDLFGGLGGVRNVLTLGDDQILKNLRGVQTARKLPLSDRTGQKDFSIEMETGTGRT